MFYIQKLETICDVNLINPSTLVLQPVQHAVIPTSVNKPPTPEFAVLQPVQHAVIPASVNKPPAPEFAVLQPVQHAVIPTSVNKPPTPEFASQERKDLEVLMPMSPVTIISPIQVRFVYWCITLFKLFFFSSWLFQYYIYLLRLHSLY